MSEKGRYGSLVRFTLPRFAHGSTDRATKSRVSEVSDKEAEISALETKIGELSTTIATNSKDLEAATAIRNWL